MNRLGFILFFVFAGLFAFMSGCTSHSPNPGAQLVQKEVWTCSMHPQIHKEGPGQCPICGMNLVKVEGGNKSQVNTPLGGVPEAHAAFSLSAERSQMIGVKTGIAEKKPLFKSIRAAGRLAFDPELYTAQNEYTEAIRQLERVKDSALVDVQHSAERMVQSAKLRLKILGLSDLQISGMSASGPADSNLLINKPGSQVWVYADVYEMDLSNLRPGLSAEMTASFLGGNRLVGKVASVDRVINPTTRTAKVRILVQQGATLMRPESYVDVTILVPLGLQVTVPFDAVLDTGKQAWVFLVGDKGQFIPRVVTVKFQAGDDVAIATGLSGGEKIVTSANFLIDSESRLKAIAPSLPTCAKGQHWDVPMLMCMPD
ncbi:efflux RND transporter periplasmic adaptor subunit [Bdellovibrionota bacterium FG-1]